MQAVTRAGGGGDRIDQTAEGADGGILRGAGTRSRFKIKVTKAAGTANTGYSGDLAGTSNT